MGNDFTQGCFVKGWGEVQTDAWLTFATLCLFVIDMFDWGGLCLFLWKWERISVTFTAKLSFIFSICKRSFGFFKCTLSLPSVFRVLFMISSSRYKRKTKWINKGIKQIIPHKEPDANKQTCIFCALVDNNAMILALVLYHITSKT